MEENTIWSILFKGEGVNWHMWSGKFMERVGIKRYHVLLIGAKKIPADDTEETQ